VKGPGGGERLTRYLLGHLPPEEAEALEAEYFADDEVDAAVQAADADLIDSFVRGRQPPDQAAIFAERQAASPGLRARVHFARALLLLADRSEAIVWPAPRRRRVLWAGIAAGLAAALAALWIASDRGTRREKETPPPVRVATFVLTEAAARDLMGTVVRVPPEATIVRLQLQLIGPPPPPPVHASLTDGEGREVWSAQNVEMRATPPGSTASVSLPADQLPAGDYELTLSGIDRTGARSPIAAYAFRAER
jgi:hypothetical protein